MLECFLFLLLSREHDRHKCYEKGSAKLKECRLHHRKLKPHEMVLFLCFVNLFLSLVLMYLSGVLLFFSLLIAYIRLCSEIPKAKTLPMLMRSFFVVTMRSIKCVM